ncbi:MinD/ParA family protein [Leifsonia sp. H3M29-4]|uniref:MinD/ParA family ATP-binding protein n=1 Tax=Salinibacterium metalliresistens TaxID=3031321 RepID=UPI0023DBA292|nr:MinD/ParA family protein [Salinibacterium metalliresistens]MDF1480140.1 MinD/ParA family protein [Salinibacterium metalliresistens]
MSRGGTIVVVKRKKPESEVLETATELQEQAPGEGEVMTFTVSLPVQVHEVPEHEAAVAIDDSGAIDPLLDATGTSTTTITLVPETVLTVPEVEPASTIPPLPEPDVVYSRRSRQPEISALPESASMLTAERLVVPKRKHTPAPEGFLQRLLYDVTFGLVNVGDSYRVRARKALDARIGKHFEGGTRFIAVLTRKGGVGKTTLTALLGMALADVRDDRVIGIDANPDRGTLAERVTKNTRATVRDVITRGDGLGTFSEFQTLVSRDATRLDVLASDTDPTVVEAFDEDDYNAVADIAQRYYSVVVTDCGTGMLHSAMTATLARADAIVVVSGGSVDEARLASETLTWLESNGYPELVKQAVVALNTATQATNLVKLEEIEAHFASRVRAIVKIPYDPSLATGSVIRYDGLERHTREAARDLAALVVDGIPAQRDA